MSDDPPFAAVYVSDKFAFNWQLHASAPGIVAIKSDNLLVSIYFLPNKPAREFEEFLDVLLNIVVSAGDTRTLLVGDFNARSHVWDKWENSRGKLLFDWTCGLDFNLINSPGVATCCRVQGESTVDLAWCSGNLWNSVTGWRILDEYNASDHKTIVIEVNDNNKNTKNSPRTLDHFPLWGVNKLDKDKYIAALHVGFWSLSGAETMNLNHLIYRINRIIKDACNISIPKCSDKKCTYWWNEEIERPREKCRIARRELHESSCA